jgi:hypothetical protein
MKAGASVATAGRSLELSAGTSQSHGAPRSGTERIRQCGFSTENSGRWMTVAWSPARLQSRSRNGRGTRRIYRSFRYWRSCLLRRSVAGKCRCCLCREVAPATDHQPTAALKKRGRFCFHLSSIWHRWRGALSSPPGPWVARCARTHGQSIPKQSTASAVPECEPGRGQRTTRAAYAATGTRRAAARSRPTQREKCGRRDSSLRSGRSLLRTAPSSSGDRSASRF